MAFEDLFNLDVGGSIQSLNLGTIISIAFLLALGILIALLARFFIKKIADLSLYPWIRKSHPGTYKRTVSGVNLLSSIVQWAIILLFIFQILSIFQIFLLQEILSQALKYLPKIALAFIVILIGLLITNIISRKIEDLEFSHSELVAKAFAALFIFATILSALEIVEIKVTPFFDIFKVGLYAVGLAFAIALGIAFGLALKPKIEKVMKDK